MDVVLRPVNDRFLEEVLFPALELGQFHSHAAIAHILKCIADEDCRVLLELVLGETSDESFFRLDDTRWSQALYRLMFHEWFRDSDGWLAAPQHTGYAGIWEETFHLALMLEDPDYPYGDEDTAELFRRGFWGQPRRRFGLASLICGAWDPMPHFPPGQVLTVEGNSVFDRKSGVARADWSWRSAIAVSTWASKLPSTLSRLLDREVKRLAPVNPPERHEILDYWLGRVDEPPILAISFSGLGPQSSLWIRRVGELARLIRAAASKEQGLTCVFARQNRRGDRDGP